MWLTDPYTTPELHRIEQLITAGHFTTALQRVETLEQLEDLPPPERLTCQLLKSPS